MAASIPGARQLGGLFSGWQGLARFWAGLLLLLVAGGIKLHFMGPSPTTLVSVTIGQPIGLEMAPRAIVDPLSVARASDDTKAADAGKFSAPGSRPGRETPGPISDPDPALLEPLASDPKLLLPRISIDGRAPMTAYAAGFDSSTLRPRIGILVAGIGMNEADSMAAIKSLPGGVTLAISPYVTDIKHLLGVARTNEHEYLLSLAMEPQGYPVNDPDDRTALMTSLTPEQNVGRLEAMLGRVSGYAGVTNLLGSMHGERLADAVDQFDPLLEEVAKRGLLFIDARYDRTVLPYVWNRSADAIIDAEPIDAATLDQRLDALAHVALDKGSALGILSAPRPVAVARISAWANTLASRGLALAPASALVLPPSKQGQEK